MVERYINRRCTFSLRSLLLGIAAVAIALLYVITYTQPYVLQGKAAARLTGFGAQFETRSVPQWVRWISGQGGADIVAVNVSDSDQVDQWLDDIVGLPSLDTLCVGGMEFSDRHLAKLKAHKTLRHLVLDSTAVSEDAIGILRRSLPDLVVERTDRRALESLREVAIIRTELVNSTAHVPGFETGDLCRLASGVAFRLDHVGAADVDLLRGCRRLRSIDLGGKSLDAGVLQRMASLEGVERLEWFDLSRTRVDDVGIRCVCQMGSLKALYLSYTRVGDDGIAVVAQLLALETLALRGTKVTDKGIRCLGALAALRELDLAETSVTDRGMQVMRELPMLHGVTRRGAAITDEGLLSLKGHEELRWLELDGTAVSDNGLRVLEGLAQLEFLSLSDTKVTAHGIEHLRQSLPRCDVIPGS